MARDAPANAEQTLTAAQIAYYAKQAGFQGNDLTTAIAVALAESSGRLTATNTNSNGSTDYGLWQINDKAHPDLITADAQWWSPPINAQMAFKVYSDAGNKFTPWSVFKSGAYVTHLGVALVGAMNPDEQGVVQAGDNTVITHNPLEDMVAPFKAIAGAVFKTAAWTSNPKNWGRVLFIGAGGALVIGSLAIMAKPYIMGAAAPIVDAATGAVPGGNAIKGVARKAAAKATTKTSAPKTKESGEGDGHGTNRG